MSWELFHIYYWSFFVCLITSSASHEKSFSHLNQWVPPGPIPIHKFTCTRFKPAMGSSGERKKCRESDTCVHFLPWLTDGASWEAARATWLQKASRLCAEIKYTDRLQITNSTCVCAAPNVHVACAWWSCWCWTSAVTSDPHLFPIPIPSGVKSGLGSPMGPSSRAATWGIKCSCIVELLYLADFLRHWCSRLLHWSSQKAACVVFYALKRPRAPRVCGFCFSGYQRYIYTHSGFIKWAERMGKID